MGKDLFATKKLTMEFGNHVAVDHVDFTSPLENSNPLSDPMAQGKPPF